MKSKFKLFVKWTFIFAILSLWTYFVTVGSVMGSLSKGFNIPVYINSSSGVERADSSDVIEMLFKHDFEIQENQEYVPVERCSLRGSEGEMNVGDLTFGSNNKLSLYIPSSDAADGKGSFTGQDEKSRFTLDFDIKEISESNSEMLVIQADGKGYLNRERINFGSITISFNKSENTIGMSGVGESADVEFEASGIKPTVVEGCVSEKAEFYLIIDNGKLEEKRSIEEVRELLSQHPELTDLYEGLDKLYRDYWWLAIPAGVIVS